MPEELTCACHWSKAAHPVKWEKPIYLISATDSFITLTF